MKLAISLVICLLVASNASAECETQACIDKADNAFQVACGKINASLAKAASACFTKYLYFHNDATACTTAAGNKAKASFLKAEIKLGKAYGFDADAAELFASQDSCLAIKFAGQGIRNAWEVQSGRKLESEVFTFSNSCTGQ